MYIPTDIHTSDVWQLACWYLFSVCPLKIAALVLMYARDCVGPVLLSMVVTLLF